MPPLRRAGHACKPWCEPRGRAFMAGEFFYDAAAGGYVFTDPELPRRANGRPFTRDTCPWCGGDLPDPVDALREVQDWGEGSE